LTVDGRRDKVATGGDPSMQWPFWFHLALVKHWHPRKWRKDVSNGRRQNKRKQLLFHKMVCLQLSVHERGEETNSTNAWKAVGLRGMKYAC